MREAGTPAASARRNSPSETTSTPDAGAEPGKRLQHGLVGIGLHGVADQRIDAVEGLGEDLVVPLQRRGRIDVEGRADRLGDFRNRHVLRMEDAVTMLEVVHDCLPLRAIPAGIRRQCASGTVLKQLEKRIEDERPVFDLLDLLTLGVRLEDRLGAARQVEIALAAAGGKHRHGKAQHKSQPADIATCHETFPGIAGGRVGFILSEIQPTCAPLIY